MEAINAKMLHRDLKPDNILLDGDIPKIGDFGLSKLVGAATRSQTFKGGQQIFYMAPEGWKFDKNEIQIDMYALGIVLYEIAALRYPYMLPADRATSTQFRTCTCSSRPRRSPACARSARPLLPRRRPADGKAPARRASPNGRVRVTRCSLRVRPNPARRRGGPDH